MQEAARRDHGDGNKGLFPVGELVESVPAIYAHLHIYIYMYMYVCIFECGMDYLPPPLSFGASGSPSMKPAPDTISNLFVTHTSYLPIYHSYSSYLSVNPSCSLRGSSRQVAPRSDLPRPSASNLRLCPSVSIPSDLPIYLSVSLSIYRSINLSILPFRGSVRRHPS